MRTRDLILPVLALTAFCLVQPRSSTAFVVFGTSLDLSQRDFRIFNNFSDPTANSNTTPDPDFPGALGAELAIWKGVAEWGSAPHGTGTTDPSQDVIGSGDSNFDAFYVGEATGVGGTNANVISQLNASLSTHAFTEVPIGDGWRMRFVDDPDDWNDGPGPPLFGAVPWDIQGTAAHEYGHALGLAHSADPTATMFASSSDRAYSFRSIEADDRAGLVALYGDLSASKPRITGYSLAAGSVILHGSGFDPVDNEVWLSQLLPGGDGTPVQVSALPSSQNGTRLSVPLPVDAGPGNVAVRLPGSSNARLSNAFPFDPATEPFFQPPQEYGAAKPSSFGTLPRLRALTLPSLTPGSTRLEATGGTQTGLGILLGSAQRGALPFQGGSLLVRAPITREQSFFFLFGLAELDVPAPPAAWVGSSRHYQVWFSDPGDPFGSGLSNGLRLTFVP